MKVTNPVVHFSTINHIRNNAITNWCEADWRTFVDALRQEQHNVSENKDVVCISPWLYKTLEQQAIARTTDDGSLWTIDDKPVVARLADNVIGTDMLMFDFDATLTIEQATYLFSQYQHLGYTSYSHRSQKKDGKDCFRIVVPLAKFVPAQEIVNRRQAIYAAFQGVDVSCLSLARSFYIPSCPPDRKALTFMWDNDGEKLFDVYDYEEDRTSEFRIQSPVVNRPIDKQRIIDALKNIYIGNEPQWFNVAVAMASNDFSYDDFCEVSIGYLMREKNERDCKDKWKSALRRINNGKTMTVGYLINLCKKHNVWVPDDSQSMWKSRHQIVKQTIDKFNKEKK